jgi:hypothetical protein
MKLSWNQSISIWWSFIWRATIYGVIGGAILGGIAGGLAVLTDSPASSIQWGQIAGYIAYIPASMLAIKQALEKHVMSLGELVARKTSDLTDSQSWSSKSSEGDVGT